MSFTHFDGRFFNADQFDAHCRQMQLGPFKPQFVVLHNTGVPTIAQRPHGYTSTTIGNLRDFYVNVQHWHGGPHLVIDQNGIWILNGLEFEGVHAPSWNHQAWGVEMLGDFENIDDPTTGPGRKIVENAVRALAALHKAAHLDSHTIHFHKEDPETRHKDCPGKRIVKADIIQRVHDRILLLK